MRRVEGVNIQKLLRHTGSLLFPRQPAVCGLNDAAIRSRDPADFEVFAGEFDRRKMVPRIDRDRLPFLAAIDRSQNHPACPDDEGVRFVPNKNAREGNVSQRILLSPTKPTVVGREDRIVRPDREPGFLIRSKMYRVKRISLRQRILPSPAEAGAELGIRGDGAQEKEN